METFWFFQLWFHCTYDSDFWFSLSHKRFNDYPYNSDSNSIAKKTSLEEDLILGLQVILVEIDRMLPDIAL